MALIIHGGAGTARPETAEDSRAGLRRALDRGWAVLARGGSCLDACEEAIVELEDEPVFDAGVGAHLNRDGRVQLDAILMEGRTLKAGAVGAVERIRNPIRLARTILEQSEHVLLVGQGAERFGAALGVPLCDPSEFVTQYEQRRWAAHAGSAAGSGTVGAVARDRFGNIAAGTSTGGTFFKLPGRIGDSPLIGCGCYADNESAAVSCTGHGESIMKVVLAKTVADLVASGDDPQAAAEKSIALLGRKTLGSGGLIVVDRQGQCGVSFSTRDMAWAIRNTAGRDELHV